MLLSIVIPCYNEELIIRDLISKALFVVKNRDIEIIFVDNGSTDKSQIIFESLEKRKHKKVKLIKIKVNKGYGFGIKKGLQLAKGRFIGWTHGDNQADILDLIRAYDIIVKNKNSLCFLKGARKGRKFVEYMFSWFMGIYFSVLFLKKSSEINAQPSIYQRKILDYLGSAPDNFLLDAYMYIVSKKIGIKEIRFPVIFYERYFGKSKWNNGLISQIIFSWKNLEYGIKLKRQMYLRIFINLF